MESLSKELLLKTVNFFSEIWNLRSLRLDDSELTLVITNLELKESDILKSFLILDFSSCKSVLKNLNLFVKKSKLIISSNKLSTQDISFVDNVLVVFLELLNLIIRFFDDVGKLFNLVVELDLCLFSNLELLLFFS